MLPTVNPEPSRCKICGNASPLFGVVDFHKSCIEAQGKRLHLSGRPIYYRRCSACGVLFTGEFDDWSVEAFRKHVYNNDYAVVDPDYGAVRPASNAKVIEQAFHASREKLSILDYGGGNGALARQLEEQGFRAMTYDPFSEFSARPAGRFNLITCFEVMEHSPFPEKTVSDMSQLLADPGLILFTTLTQPANFDELGLQWWYVGPRNGHVSVYSRQSLAILFEKAGLQLVSFSELVHVAYRQLPAFAAHLLPKNPA
jgi:hypothetical protein